jgi:hypothetical protein
MRRGPPPIAREAVQRAIEQAGAEGITGQQIAERLGMTMVHVKAQVFRLRADGRLLLVSRRFGAAPARYWASADLMPPLPLPPVIVKRKPGPTAAPKPVPAPRPITRTQRIIDWLADHPAGGLPGTIAEALGLPKGIVSSLLSNIAADGHAVGRPAPKGKAVRRLHYWAPQHLPPLPPPAAAPLVRAKPARLPSLAPAVFADAPVDYSRAVVTVCPSGQDHRFSFTPPPGWRGTITRDWQERRLQEQQHGC